MLLFFFFQAEDGIRDHCVTGVQTCALPISLKCPPDVHRSSCPALQRHNDATLARRGHRYTCLAACAPPRGLRVYRSLRHRTSPLYSAARATDPLLFLPKRPFLRAYFCCGDDLNGWSKFHSQSI